MAQCPDGHESTARDFCDKCGLPMPEVAESSAAAPPSDAPPASAPTQPQVCPNCGAPRLTGALFCESCGYDYTTGALPQQDFHTQLGLTPPAAPVTHQTETEDTPQASPSVEPMSVQVPDSIDESYEDSTFIDIEPGPSSAAHETPLPGHLAKAVPHVAEVWIDPQWYGFQESEDPLPPQGSPRIVILADSALIGRRSASRNINPDIDCEPDAGVSRRQAYLTSADGHWYVSDLDSANGTFVGAATAALPDQAITSRTRVTPDSRIYVGAWTRIVVRPAIPSDHT